MLRNQMQEYVDLSREIVKIMVSDDAAAALKKSLDCQEAMIDKLLDTEVQMPDLIKGTWPNSSILLPGLIGITTANQHSSKASTTEEKSLNLSTSTAASIRKSSSVIICGASCPLTGDTKKADQLNENWSTRPRQLGY